jgi:hypothetical protein
VRWRWCDRVSLIIAAMALGACDSARSPFTTEVARRVADDVANQPSGASAALDGDVPMFHNAPQAMVARFEPDALTLRSAETGGGARSDWEARVAVDGFGCGDALERLGAAAAKADQHRIEQEHGPLTAWYLNGPAGIEQGFTVPEAPACVADGGALTIAMAVDGLSPRLREDGRAVELTDASGHIVLRYAGLHVVDAEGAVLPGSLRVDGRHIAIDVDARDAVFPVVVDPTWSQQAKLTPSDASTTDLFGQAVSIWGDTALVGAPNNIGAQLEYGAGYAFVRNAGVWSEQAKLMAGDAPTNRMLGHAASLWADTALLGAPGDDAGGVDAGAAYVFVRNGGSWSEQAKLVAGDPASADQLGFAVGIAGDTAVVGAPTDDDGGGSSGSAYVFVRSGGTWSQQAKLVAADASSSDRFGWAVAIDGETVVVGADGDGAGSAYVFVRSNGVWSQQAKLVASDAAAADAFGWSVSVSGDTAVIGAKDDDDPIMNSGSAYVFVRTGSAWSQQAKLSLGLAGVSQDQLGTSVSVSGDRALVGAQGADGWTGRAHLFVRAGGSWFEGATLEAADGTILDAFGASVGLSGGTGIVGAPWDDAAGANSGSAYAFVLVPGADGTACIVDGDCQSAHCVDGVCCQSACGASPGDCQGCSAALTGDVDGVCAPVLAGTTCRAAAGACDAQEQCDGSAAACPADAKLALTPCRAAVDVCDAEEACDGASDACPADAMVTAGTTCRAPDGECDIEEQCDGVLSACPADASAPDGTTCQRAGVCVAGECESGQGGQGGQGGASATSGAGGMADAGGADGAGGASSATTGSGGGTAPPRTGDSAASDEGCSCAWVGVSATDERGRVWEAMLLGALWLWRRRRAAAGQRSDPDGPSPPDRG